MLAVSLDCIDVAQCLLRGGKADPNVRDKLVRRLLHNLRTLLSFVSHLRARLLFSTREAAALCASCSTAVRTAASANFTPSFTNLTNRLRPAGLRSRTMWRGLRHSRSLSSSLLTTGPSLALRAR